MFFLRNFQYEFNLGVLQMKVKTCLMSTVYKKALVLSNDGRRDFSTGQIINMMSVDVQAIVDYILMINVVWSSPIQLLVCFYLLWQQLGIATLAGAATLILLVPVNGKRALNSLYMATNASCGKSLLTVVHLF